ncbi:GNAT family N-acetyltransferase [Starkeya koreensis]|uniref:GNAT family N-acetyltransferase n=1 Tax=Ancylobacter koreensis TaxID=266121 RepID=A0ABT0DQV4_9HYPH|nr:GNAT family N-acetyltransferase [Ancylobacter koreensis]MCK0209660.1 GNAT family N-acetyltransferase [Ancylobacter koreensis]
MTDTPIPAPRALNLDGYTALPPGKNATVVTFLEMRAPPVPLAERAEEGFRLRHVTKPDTEWYRTLFRAIGEDWLWFSRARMDDAALAAIIADPQVEIYVLEREGAGGSERDLGLVELDFRQPGEAELAFFGVVPALVGVGAGRFMINRANERAWSRGISRFFVHTCTNDHPGALGFYRKAGFVPVAQSIEVVDDPRLTGALPRGAAPHIPIVGG